MAVHAVPAAQKAVFLYEGTLHILSLSPLRHAYGEKKSSLNDVHLVCVEHSAPDQQVCVAVRKQTLELYSFGADGMVRTCSRDLPEKPTAMCRVGRTICMAGRHGYFTVPVDDADAAPLIEYNAEWTLPLAVPVGTDRFLVTTGISASETLGHVVFENGAPALQPIMWTGAQPLAAVAPTTMPYLISLCKTRLDVHSLMEGNLTQSLQFNDGCALVRSHDRDGSVGGSGAYVAAARMVYCLAPVPLEVQLDQLLQAQRASEALRLVEAAEAASRTLPPAAMASAPLSTSSAAAIDVRRRIIWQRVGFGRLAAGDLDEARSMFLRCGFDPRELIARYPGLLPRQSRFVPSQPLQSGLESIAKVRGIEPFLLGILLRLRRERGLGRNRIRQHVSRSSARSATVTESAEKTASSAADQGQHPSAPLKPGPLAVGAGGSGEASTVTGAVAGERSNGANEGDDGDEEEEEEEDENEDDDAIVVGGASDGTVMIGDDGSGAYEIDTAIVKLLAMLSQREPRRKRQLSRFLRKPNRADVSECEQCLRDTGNFHALAQLFGRGGRYADALEMWIRLDRGELTDPTYPGIEFLAKFICRLGNSSGGGDVRGGATTTATTATADLVLKGARYVLDRNIRRGVQLFTGVPTTVAAPAATPRAAAGRPGGDRLRLPPDTVLEVLSAYGDTALRLYLEYLVDVEGSMEPRHHTQLALLYADAVLDPRCTDRPAARQLLRRFIERSPVLTVPLVLDRIRGTDLHTERAYLFGRQGDHDRALHILVYELKEYDAAEQYCMSIGRPRSALLSTDGAPAAATTRAMDAPSQLPTAVQPAQQQQQRAPSATVAVTDATADGAAPTAQPTRADLLIRLLKLYITAPSIGDASLMQQAVGVLNRRAEELDAAQVVAMLPPTWSVQSVFGYMRRALRDSMHRSREASIVNGLCRTEYLRLCYERACAERPVAALLTRETRCGLCRGTINDDDLGGGFGGGFGDPSRARNAPRIGRAAAAAIVRRPDGSLVHEACLRHYIAGASEALPPR